MLDAITTLMDAHAVTFKGVDLYAVGLGPGNFTGLRIALSAVRALALPAQTDVIGVSSAEAVAARIQDEQSPTGRIVVVGDARRHRLWMGSFDTSQSPLRIEEAFSLIPIDEFANHLRQGDTVVSPDWDRLEAELRGIIPAEVTLIEAPQLPAAVDVARLARHRKVAGIASDPLEPIYMHPPVFIEPRFSGSARHHP